MELSSVLSNAALETVKFQIHDIQLTFMEADNQRFNKELERDVIVTADWMR